MSKLTVGQLIDYLEQYRGVCKQTGEEYNIAVHVKTGLLSNEVEVRYVNHGTIILRPKKDCK